MVHCIVIGFTPHKIWLLPLILIQIKWKAGFIICWINLYILIITANKSEIEWVNYKEVFGLDWKLTVLYYDTDTNLLFIHSSDKSSLYQQLANAVLNDNAVLINQINVFKTFYDIKRVSLQNVGLKEFLNRKIRTNPF